jgi:hypothetical protein
MLYPSVPVLASQGPAMNVTVVGEERFLIFLTCDPGRAVMALIAKLNGCAKGFRDG